LVLTNNSTNVLYQAYVGRFTGNSISVRVDDEPIQTGTTGTTIGNAARTWYDGISYAKVELFKITSVAYNSGGATATLRWNSVPASQSLTTPTYTVQKKNSLSDPGWNTLAVGIPSDGTTTSFIDTSVTGAAFYRISSP